MRAYCQALHLLPTPTTAAAADIAGWDRAIRGQLYSSRFAGAFSAFVASIRAGVRPNHATLPLLNRAVSSLPFALPGAAGAAHAIGLRLGFSSDVYFCNTLITAYAAHALVASARRVFDDMPAPDIVSWTSVISTYLRSGVLREGYRLFAGMRACGHKPNPVTLTVLLQGCTGEKDIVGGRQLHCLAIKNGSADHDLVLNSILTLLSKAGCSGDAVSLFDEARYKDVVSWNIMIREQAATGDMSMVLATFDSMRTENDPSFYTLTIVMSALAKHGCFFEGQQMHCYIVKSALADDILFALLIKFYSEIGFGSLTSSVRIFEALMHRASASIWSAMLWAFIRGRRCIDGINLVQRMQSTDLERTFQMILGLIVIASDVGDLKLGKATHCYIIRHGVAEHSDYDNMTLVTAILKMYACCGCISLAKRCFDRATSLDIVTWSAMIEAYAVNGHASNALKLFDQLQQHGVAPNRVTFLSLLSACCHGGCLSEALQLLHCMIKKFGIDLDLRHYACVMDALGRSGKLDEAMSVATKMEIGADIRVWRALLSSCRTHLEGDVANRVAREVEIFDPDDVGYNVTKRNIEAGMDRWNCVESIQESMMESEVKKLPGLSCLS